MVPTSIAVVLSCTTLVRKGRVRPTQSINISVSSNSNSNSSTAETSCRQLARHMCSVNRRTTDTWHRPSSKAFSRPPAITPPTTHVRAAFCSAQESCHSATRSAATACLFVRFTVCPLYGTRERLAMSQSPVSDMFQSGGQPMGKTFNLLAGLETPTPNANLRRVSAQSQFESRYNDGLSGSPAQTMQAPNLSTANHFNTASSSSGQHFSPWPLFSARVK